VVHRALIDGNIPFEGSGIGPGHRPLPGLPTAISAASDAGNAVLDYMSRACLRGSAHMCVVSTDADSTDATGALALRRDYRAWRGTYLITARRAVNGSAN
jgi:hypothetical protein